MVTFHYIEFKAFIQATEDPDKVIQSIVNIAGEEIELEREDAEGYYGNPIQIVTGKIHRNREMDAVFDRLPRYVLEELLSSLKRRIDDRCNFYFRLDKQKAFQEEFELSEGNNTIRARARVESYPASREKALDHMQNYLEERLDEEG